jgi:hypothetical protein
MASVLALAIFAAALVAVGAQILAPDASAPAVPSNPAQSGSTAPEWVPLISRAHGFRIDLPAPPQDLSAAAGLGSDIDATWMAVHPTVSIMVKATRCPERLCREAPDSVLRGVQEGALEEWGGTLLSEKSLQLPCPQGSCPGLEFEATTRQGLRVSARYFIAREKVFQVLGTQSSGSNEIFQKVVSSFSFL